MMDTDKIRKVSIILPVYNGEKHVADAIESVLKQTYSNLELIIVNDCSTDKTSEILERYAKLDSRIKVFNNPVNLKLPNTLNVGFEHASGDYYTWTSDDNLYKRTAIEKMVSELTSNTNVDMVYADFTNINVDGKVISEVCLREPNELVFTNVIGACFLYTREVAEKVGKYDANLFLAEDYDYWIRILRAGNIVHLSENLYYYRRHAESLSETRKELIGMQTYRAMEKNFLFLFSLTKNRKDRYQFFDYLFIRLGRQANTEIKEMLKRVDSSYFIYVRIKSMKKYLAQFILSFYRHYKG